MWDIILYVSQKLPPVIQAGLLYLIEISIPGRAWSKSSSNSYMKEIKDQHRWSKPATIRQIKLENDLSGKKVTNLQL